MDIYRKARFDSVMFQRGCSLTYGLSMQGCRPAGLDGVRGWGSCLHIEFDAVLPYRIVLTPV